MYAGRAGHTVRKPVAVCTAHATTARTHMQRCAHIIAVSAAVKSGLLVAGYPADRVQLIYNGVPEGPPPPTPAERAALRAELGIGDHVFAVAHVGRFVKDKGQDLLVQAMRSTPAHLHLYLVGDAQTEFGRSVLQMLDAHPHLRSRVHFLGYRNDVQRLLPAFDAFALASRREALSIAVIEAFAAGVPVVATEVGGVPEIVRHETTGLLVPTEDAAALAQALSRLSENAALRAELVDHGLRLYHDELTAGRMLARTLAVYQQCLETARP